MRSRARERVSLAGALTLLCAAVGLLLPTEGALAVAPLGKSWQRGAIIPPSDAESYSSADFDSALAALRETGSTHVNLYVEWYMRHRGASRVRPNPRMTPTDGSLRHAMEAARSLGMTPVLTLVVRVRDGTWQALIDPRNRGKWFASYRDMARRYARLGRAGGAGAIVIGAELESMARSTARWRRVIRTIRARFGGRLTYSANGPYAARKVRFWSQLDYIATTGYMSLARGPNPSVRRLVRAWRARGYVRQLNRLRRRHHMPVIFTEIGYGSWEGTAARPWAGVDGPISQVPQRRAYEAAYRVWSRIPWFKGLYWWRWLPGGHDPADGSHSPRGKRAEATMTAWSNAS